jgi:outer membrane protein assembly factor BamB
MIYRIYKMGITMKPLVLLVLFLSSVTVNAQNWPSFRGPNASGVAEGTNPPITWDLEKSQNVLWKTNIPGLSHSSPIVWGNNIFVITAVSSEAKPTFKAKDRGIGLANDGVSHTWMIFALDKRNGRVIWSEKAYEGVPRAKRHVKATQANSTPVTDGRYVVALFGSEGLR